MRHIAFKWLAVSGMASLLLGCCQQSPPAPTIAASVTIPASSASTRAIGKIGHAGPTSGAIPHVEKDNENDARLAVEVLNGIGVAFGGMPVSLELMFEDDAADPKHGTTAEPKFVDAKVRQCFKTAFTVVADGAQLGSSLGKYAVGTLKGKAMAEIDDRTAYGQVVADQFTKAIIAAGAQVVAKEFTTDMATDFSAILTTRKSKKT